MTGVQLFGNEVVPGVLGAMTEADARFIRIPVEWRYIEPADMAPPEFLWGILDPQFTALAAGGFEAVPVIIRNPLWASSNGCGKLDLVPYSRFQSFVNQLVERYDGDGVTDAPGSPRVQYWEIGNEPDYDANFMPAENHGSCFGGSAANAAEYAKYLRAAFLGARSADPTAKIIFAGVAYDRFRNGPVYSQADGRFDYYFTQNTLLYLYTNHATENGYPFYDWMSIHIYNDFRDKWKFMETFSVRELRAKVQHFKSNQLKFLPFFDLSSKPIVITEIGLVSGPTDAFTDKTEAIQAVYPGQVLARIKAEKMPLVTWFVGKDSLYGDCANGYDWLLYGLVRSLDIYNRKQACSPLDPLPGYQVAVDNERKPAHTASQVAAQQIGHALYANQMTLSQTGSNQTEAYRFYVPQTDRYTIVAFTDTGERLGKKNVAPLIRTMTFSAAILPGWTGRIAIIDYLGNTTYATGTSIPVTIRQDPVYVRPD